MGPVGEPSAFGAGIEVRPPHPDRDMPALVDLRCRAFGRLTEGQRAAWAAKTEPEVREHRVLGAFDGARLVAMARFHDMEQCWHGRAVPMAGVAGVAVAPEERGRGVGRRLMTALLETIAGRGYPLAVLFPTTFPIYRSLGWEVAGTSYEAAFPAAALRPLASPGRAGQGPAQGGQHPGVRRAGPGDAAQMREVICRVHTASRDCGPSVPAEALLRSVLADPQNFCYLAGDGVLSYTWHDGHDELFVYCAAAASAQTTRALWAVAASNCWLADTVRARLAPADPLWWLTPDPVADAVDHDDWMLRVVDAPAAIAARGFPLAADLALPLYITDDTRPANAGWWQLKVSGGRGSLTRGGEPAGAEPLALGARGMAALYAGTPAATLRRAGLAEGGDETGDALLDSAFGGTPYLLDRF
jgi:predicted acetyltransferase